MTPRRAEMLLGAAGALACAGLAWAEGLGPAGLAGGAVLGGALGAARERPRAAWLAAVVALLVLAPAGVSWGVAAFVALHAFCAGRWESGPAAVTALAALVGALELGVLLTHDSFVPALLIPAAAWGAGRALRAHETLAAQLAERARELEEEREAHAALSVRHERARIASELHDIVAHAISVMVVQASAGQRLATRDPQATAEAFDAIAGAARQAEEDMGRLVALLADDAAGSLTPDLTLIDELVARAAGSGLDVTVRFEGERESLPAELADAAYHVVQEGLTNALRYAAGATVSVLVRGDRDALTVEVTNAPATREPALAGAGTGTGIQGLRERVGNRGGTLTAGPTPAGGWRLHAHLPRRIAAASLA